MNRLMRHSVFVLPLLFNTIPGRSEGQDLGGSGLGITAGAVYLRVLEGHGFGAELDLRWPIPLNVLHSRSAIGMRVWAVQLGRPNTWMNDLRVVGIGLRWRSQWDLVGKRVRAHLTVPVELIRAGTYGVQEMDLLCVLTEQGEVCEIGGGDIAPAVGVGTGLDLMLTGSLHVATAVSALWTSLERSGNDPAYTVFLGLGFSWNEPR